MRDLWNTINDYDYDYNARKLTLRPVEALSFLVHEDEEEKERHV